MEKQTAKMEKYRKTGGGGTPLRDPSFSLEALREREALLITALAECADTFCQFNATRDTVLGAPDQAADAGPQSSFTQLADRWSKELDVSQRDRFLAFLSPERLESCYERDRRHISALFRTEGEGEDGPLVRQSVLLYKDPESEDLLGIAYGQLVARDLNGDPAEDETDKEAYRPPLERGGRIGGSTMTAEECYQRLEGDYAEVSERLPSLRLVEKFIGRFLEDRSFDALCSSMESGNREEAFRAAHTLKGVCANLSFTRLLTSTARLTEELRGEADGISDTARVLMEDVRRDYQMTVSAIRAYMGKE